MRAGIIGTGEMGRPLVGRLVAAGFEVTAFARRPDVRAELAESGVRCVGAVTELAGVADVVLVYVYSDEQVREVVLESGLADAMAEGSLLVVHTTGSPLTVEAIDARVRPRGVGVVDAPGSGGPAQVADGSLTLFAGGDTEHVERCRPLFAAYAAQVVHFGALGSGQKVKLLNNLLFGAHIELALEAARLSDSFGIDQARLAAALHTCSGASYALDLVAQLGSAQTLVQSAGRFVHKDVLMAQKVAEELDAPLGTISALTAPLLEKTRPR
ncbi:NAD(P)-dependent oxidoreductase [Actinomadura rugatobispora]|uniref:NAD(P)-dependent oxidoreductase n=1 Tax=Actinomadura rugatobispora TaxID=1994 RepID=A0ABW0ZTJ7_9ACTN|nr:NAD(P)-dependent oxidoreductase [Actinomadura rugatobispora]